MAWLQSVYQKLLETEFDILLWKIGNLKDWKTKAEALGCLSKLALSVMK